MRTIMYVAGGMALASALFGFNIFNLRTRAKLWIVKLGIQKAGEKISEKVEDVVDRVRGRMAGSSGPLPSPAPTSSPGSSLGTPGTL